MCLYPTLRKNKKYTMTKKNGGQVPPISDIRVTYVATGCGNCMECRQQYARDWQVRLLEDVRHNKNGKFVTLTFSDESIKKISRKIKGLEGYNLDNEIATYAVRHFYERYRKKYKKSLRHWLVTELGHENTENIHLHGIIWCDNDLNEIEKFWKYGWVWKGKETEHGIINYVNEQTTNYITKYITKIDDDHKEYKPKVLASKGIGKAYLDRDDAKRNKFKDKDTKEYYTTRTGHKLALPKYYRNKLYTDDEKEKLWLNLLDKNVRYVCGEKIDVSETDTDYWDTVRWYREKNEQLGYGDDSKNWDRKRYENERRKMLQKQRIERAEQKELPRFAWGGLGEDIKEE